MGVQEGSREGSRSWKGAEKRGMRGRREGSRRRGRGEGGRKDTFQEGRQRFQNHTEAT